MKLARQALEVARIEAGQGTPEQKTRVMAWDRLNGMLGALESKTSVLLRFNAIVVAALAYVVVVRASDPFMGSNPTIKTLGLIVGHASLIASVLSCGFAFPVINIEQEVFGSRADRITAGEPGFDDAAVQRLGNLLERRTRYYARAWQLAVTGGTGFAILTALATLH
jgi:hypothetical protein